MHKRFERDNKFNLPSMRTLWKELGEYDALVQYMECAIRGLSYKYKQQELDFRTFIKNEPANKDIHLGSIKIEDFANDVIRWYMIHPYACFDKFVHSFISDLKVFGIDISLNYSSLNPLDSLLRGMKDKHIENSVHDNKIKLANYYRLNRNFSAHHLENNKAISIYDKIDKDFIYNVYPTLKSALQGVNNLYFADYTLCTANLKNIADTLTTDAYNNIDWTKYDVLSDCGCCKKAKGYTEERALKYTSNFISGKYGIKLSDEDCEKIMNKIRE